MRNNYTHIIILLDKSGSMTVIKNDMESGLQSFINEQKLVEGDCTVTIAEFNHDYEIVHNRKDIQEIDKIEIEPEGSTALIDSMVRLILESSRDLSLLNDNEKPDRVLFVTITDGQENASRTYTSAYLKDLIESQKKDFNWNFVYLGANQDSFDVASEFGINLTSTANYTATREGISTMTASLSKSTVQFRSASNVTYDTFTYNNDTSDN